MADRRKPHPAPAVLRRKIKQIEERLAQLEDHLKVVRIEATRTSGRARIRLNRLERTASAQVTRAQERLKELVARLGQVLAGAKTREEVTRQVASARAALQDSLDRLGRTLAESTQSAKQEMGLLTRGLKAGLRAGSETYRRKRS